MLASDSSVGAGCRRGPGGSGDTLCRRPVAPEPAELQLLLFCRSRSVSRGAGCCFSLGGDSAWRCDWVVAQRGGPALPPGAWSSQGPVPCLVPGSTWAAAPPHPGQSGHPYHRTCWASGGSDCCRRAFPRRSRSSRPLLTGKGACAGGRLSALGAGGSAASDDCRRHRGRWVGAQRWRDPLVLPSGPFPSLQGTSGQAASRGTKSPVGHSPLTQCKLPSLP